MKKLIIVLISFCLFISILFAESVWHDDFDKIENWYDNRTDDSFNAVIVPGKKKGTAEVIQKGKLNWGKVAFVVKDIDLDKFNIIQTKINKVDKNGDYKILVTLLDWSESYTIIDRGNGIGIKQGDIKEITGWQGTRSFNIVIVVEGKDKKVELDWIEITEKPETTKDES